MIPAAVRNGRQERNVLLREGATTRRGDPITEEINPLQPSHARSLGFAPRKSLHPSPRVQ